MKTEVFTAIPCLWPAKAEATATVPSLFCTTRKIKNKNKNKS